MVDAADSKSATCEGVGVQVPSPVFLSLRIFLPYSNGSSYLLIRETKGDRPRG